MSVRSIARDMHLNYESPCRVFRSPALGLDMKPRLGVALARLYFVQYIVAANATAAAARRIGHHHLPGGQPQCVLKSVCSRSVMTHAHKGWAPI
eukprot:3761157-Pleurochrysis_carterae.AAC.4